MPSTDKAMFLLIVNFWRNNALNPQECPWAKAVVGGAVMTQEYADSIGADFYGKDAMNTVKYAQRHFGVVQ